MCCVVGYVGSSVSKNRILEGLSRLEYRGYDSAGCAFSGQQQGPIRAIKTVGGVDRLRERAGDALYEGAVGIGHTRWSTHGAVTEENAHPLFDCTGSVAVVHNGVIENERALRKELAKRGHCFRAATDSELIAHCFEELLADYPDSTAEALVQRVVARLQGAYAFVAMIDRFPGMLFMARCQSPLCLGQAADGLFVASDQLAFAGEAREVTFIPDHTYGFVTATGYRCWSLATHELLSLPAESLTVSWSAEGKQGHPHFMIKEMYEQPAIIARLAEQAPFDLKPLVEVALERKKKSSVPQEILLYGCGTALHAAEIGRWYGEAIAGLPVKVVMASELRERPIFAEQTMLAIAISQSGETADTLEATRALQAAGIPCGALTNVISSSLARLVDVVIPVRAGVEIAVATTKAFTAQVALLYLFFHEYAYAQGDASAAVRDQALRSLQQAGLALQEGMIRNSALIDAVIAPRYATAPQAIFIGRQIGYVMAKEGALKLKEIAYIFAEAYAAGELKHGHLALVAPGLPVIVCSVLDETAYRKLVTSVQEVRARHGRLIIIAFEGQEELMALADELLVVPQPVDPLLAPLAMAGVLQYLAYRCAFTLQLPIDKPRNLAKSVTVE